jgi:hypothetical protein
MKKIFLNFIFGFTGSIVSGTTVLMTMYFTLRLLPLPINLDNEKTFFAALYSFIAIVALAAIAGAIGGVVYSRKFLN